MTYIFQTIRGKIESQLITNIDLGCLSNDENSLFVNMYRISIGKTKSFSLIINDLRNFNKVIYHQPKSLFGQFSFETQ